jgi:hypothetical protein
MASFVEFEVLSEDISTGDVHDFAADSFKWYFTNTAPDAAADTQKTELPSELANGNGYTTGGLAADLSALPEKPQKPSQRPSKKRLKRLSPRPLKHGRQNEPKRRCPRRQRSTGTSLPSKSLVSSD